MAIRPTGTHRRQPLRHARPARCAGSRLTCRSGPGARRLTGPHDAAHEGPARRRPDRRARALALAGRPPRPDAGTRRRARVARSASRSSPTTSRSSRSGSTAREPFRQRAVRRAAAHPPRRPHPAARAFHRRRQRHAACSASGSACPAPSTARATASSTRPPLGWNQVPLGATLRRELGLPVLVENNVNALAMAERLYGVGRRHESFLVVTIGTGVGAGIVVDGVVLRGSSGGAGEIGHTARRSTTARSAPAATTDASRRSSARRPSSARRASAA